MQLTHPLIDADDGDVILLYFPVESVPDLLLQFLNPGIACH
jgi:hypothetical protein